MQKGGFDGLKLMKVNAVKNGKKRGVLFHTGTYLRSIKVLGGEKKKNFDKGGSLSQVSPGRVLSIPGGGKGPREK